MCPVDAWPRSANVTRLHACLAVSLARRVARTQLHKITLAAFGLYVENLTLTYFGHKDEPMAQNNLIAFRATD